MPTGQQLPHIAQKQSGFTPIETDTPYLHSLCVYKGKQRSRRSSYHVAVKFYHVDFAERRVCGELKIEALAQASQDVTTFFDAEIITTKDDFFTRRWGAEDAVDLSHWSRLHGFSVEYACEDGAYDFRTNRFIFMRWKEKFVVPFWEPQEVPGASYAGFYYISLDRLLGRITGFYFFSHSERYQLLQLTYDDSERVFQKVQML
eukprot:m.21932 g.21932  ORF g.21932 m.21932 type:complete len:203 (-) comp9207_c0_seq1:702-1310(-)